MNAEQKLLARFEKAKDPKKRLTLLIQLSDLFYRNDGAKSLAYGQQAFDLACKVGLADFKARSLACMADAHFCLCNYQMALTIFEESLRICLTLDDTSIRSDILGQYGVALASQGSFERSLEVYEEAVQLNQLRGDKAGMAGIYRRIGEVYYQLSDFPKAFDFFCESLRLSREVKDRRKEAVALDRIGLIYNESNEHEKSLESFFEAIPIYYEVGEELAAAAVLANIGIAYHEHNEYGRALQYLYEALSIQELYSYKLSQIYSYCNIANVLIDMGDIEAARINAEKAMALTESIDHHLVAKISSHLYYAKVLNRLAQPERALHHSKTALSFMEEGQRQELHVLALEEITFSYEQLGDNGKALEFHKRLLAFKLNDVTIKKERDLRYQKMRHEIEKKETEKENYRLKTLQLESELKANIERVAKLGQEIIDKNDFLSFLKKKIQGIIPSANGNERILQAFAKEIEQKIASDDLQQQFNTALSQLHSEFHILLTRSYPDLTSTEKKVCSLIKLGMHSQQIADLLFASIRTVEGHRLKIRKKLGLAPHTDMEKFLRDTLPSNLSKS